MRHGSQWLRFFLLLLAVAMPEAWAQCGPGIPGGGNPSCVPPDVFNQSLPRSLTNAPAAEWADQWGAISISENGEIGFSENEESRSRAETFARARCQIDGGINCDMFSYSNECAVLAWGTGFQTRIGAKTVESASQLALSACMEQAPDCEVIYHQCSLPRRVR